MTRRTIVDELHAIREEIARECAYDVHELFKSFRRNATSSHVAFPPRRSTAGAVQNEVEPDSSAPSPSVAAPIVNLNPQRGP